jgi:hypothetical protein
MLRRGVSEGPAETSSQAWSESSAKGGGRARGVAPRDVAGAFAKRVAERAECSREALRDVVGRAQGDRVELVGEGFWEGVGGGR